MHSKAQTTPVTFKGLTAGLPDIHNVSPLPTDTQAPLLLLTRKEFWFLLT